VDTWELSGDDDLRLIQHCASRLWSPSSWWHTGGLAWQGGSITDRGPARVLLFGSRGGLAAWAWLERPGHLSAQIDPAHPELAPGIVAWFAENGTGARLTVQVAAGDDALRGALDAAGFSELVAAPYFLDMRQAAGRRPMTLPEGYCVRSVQPDDVTARVRLHQAAWEPGRLPFHPDHRPVTPPGAKSSFGEEDYRRVQSTWPYRPELDLVAVAPDGTLAASCIAWLDDTIGVAEIEPVGTAPSHRGLGLAAAVCLAAVDAVSMLAGTEVVIHARGDAAYPVPRRVYRRCGFSAVSRTSTYARTPA
jgi:GNAT superfamily N-acetyltransferase